MAKKKTKTGVARRKDRSPQEKQFVLSDITFRLKEGQTAGEIKDYYSNHSEYSMHTINHYISECYKGLQGETLRDVDTIISQHTKRYEKMYNKITNARKRWQDAEEEEPKDAFVIRKKIMTEVINAVDALFRKEKLLGLHEKDVSISINNTLKKTTNKVNQMDKYDLSKLTLQEKIELLNLINESRVDVIEGIIPLRYKPDRDIEDAIIIEETRLKPSEVPIEAVIHDVQIEVIPQIRSKPETKMEVFEELKRRMREEIAETYQKQDSERKERHLSLNEIAKKGKTP